MFWSRLVPVALLLLFFGVALVWRAIHQRRRFGAFGIQVLRERGLNAVVGLVLTAGTLLLFVQSAVWALEPARVEPSFVFTPSTELTLAGALLVLVALGLLVAAQLELGASWRVGIEPGAAPGLVTHGFYRYVRNPIFAFLLVAMVGFALLLPTWLSLVMVLGSWAGVRLQVAREETYLLATYGEAYRNYCARVGRLLPGIGRASVRPART
jgi:protein-S-isoprenylcysteine O-methyltransferase Ste14